MPNREKESGRVIFLLSLILLVGLVVSPALAIGVSISSGADCMYNCYNMTSTSSASYNSGGTTFPVIFSESGLATGTPWSVTIGGQMESSTNTTVTFYESAGTYFFQVNNVGGYDSDFTSGDVTVGNGPVPYVLQKIVIAPYGAGGIAFDPKNGYVYTVDASSGNVSIINGGQVISVLHLGHEMTVQYTFTPAPTMLAYDPSNGFVYVTAYNSTDVFVINGTNLLGTVSLGMITSSSNFSLIDSTST